MRPFHDWSIRHKLTGLFIAMACIAAVTVSAPMGVFDYFGLRRAMARDLATLADVLARNSTAALTFRDAHAARDVLQALRAEPSVTVACIYTDDGKPFAVYVRQGKESDFVPPLAQDPVTRFESNHLLQFRDIVLDGETVGTIYIESDLQSLDKRLREYTLAFLCTLLVTLALALVIATRLQRPISRPLADLMDTAKAISAAGDYSIRADLPNRDEFGVLASEFNAMLEQIEERDRQLRQHRAQLAQEVASRTAELLDANAQLRRAEEKYRAIFEDAVVGIFQITPEGRPVSINRALAQMHGFDSPEHFLAEISDLGSQLFVQTSRMQEFRRELAENGVVRGAEVQFYRRDRTKKWALINIRAVHDNDGNIVFHEGTVEDVTDRKFAEERVQFLAYYDALTGLPNRTLLHDRLATALAGARRRNEKVAVLFLDLDRFKVINDSLGHSIGDLLLQKVAERLKTWARAQDTVSRIGGYEFIVLLTALNDVPDAAVAAERMMDMMTAEFVVQDQSFNISCSIGLSIFPEHGADGEALIKNADAAMYCAKDNGRNNFQFFTEEMNAQVMERLTLENSLRLALDRKELFLMYQPQMDMATERIIGVEALIRWQHPELGLVPPDKFIRIAENCGLILPIGEWVLRSACSQARKWQDEGLLPLPVAVNVSAVQFRNDGFRELIGKVLRETGLAPQFLELELTESLLLSNADVIFSVLQELKEMGLKLAIDDFGTGFSSLSYLRQFPVGKLKIDRSFVRDVALNSDDAAITTAIISMAKGLNLKVIAEGVENEAQMSFLRAQHCDGIQGYYFSKPLTVDDVTDKLRSAAAHAFSAHQGPN
jgi:diguanylate cyclase (GGDEF)-like protein/PAS domain S-box-containing protein